MPRPNVPVSWRAPDGPYRQAPPEYGGEWWLVNPFTGNEPWLRRAPAKETLPDGFVAIFGPRPQSADFPTNRAWTFARNQWLTDLRTFVAAGHPDGYTIEQTQIADGVFQAWRMGEAAYYQNVNGWRARWPHSQVVDFEQPAAVAVELSHISVALYQAELIERGLFPAEGHTARQ